MLTPEGTVTPHYPLAGLSIQTVFWHLLPESDPLKQFADSSCIPHCSSVRNRPEGKTLLVINPVQVSQYVTNTVLELEKNPQAYPEVPRFFIETLLKVLRQVFLNVPFSQYIQNISTFIMWHEYAELEMHLLYHPLFDLEETHAFLKEANIKLNELNTKPTIQQKLSTKQYKHMWVTWRRAAHICHVERVCAETIAMLREMTHDGSAAGSANQFHVLLRTCLALNALDAEKMTYAAACVRGERYVDSTLIYLLAFLSILYKRNVFELPNRQIISTRSIGTRWKQFLTDPDGYFPPAERQTFYNNLLRDYGEVHQMFLEEVAKLYRAFQGAGIEITPPKCLLSSTE